MDELSGFLDDSKASYGYARISYSNDKESQREKFVLVVWIGKDTKVMRKAKARLFSWLTNYCMVNPGLDIRPLGRRQVCFKGVLH